MRENFEKWMEEVAQYKPTTLSAYSTAITRISQHYSEATGGHIDIYHTNDIPLLKGIRTEYCTGGRFEDFGDNGHGTIKAAISAYIHFLEEIEAQG